MSTGKAYFMYYMLFSCQIRILTASPAIVSPCGSVFIYVGPIHLLGFNTLKILIGQHDVQCFICISLCVGV